MTDNEFIEKLNAIKNKRARLIKRKNNRAFVEIYINQFINPKYKIAFATIHRARIFLLSIAIFDYAEVWEEDTKNEIKYQTIFDKE